MIERLDIKQALYKKLDAVRKPGSRRLLQHLHDSAAGTVPDLPESFTRDFCITHFFNPPRYMRLLELVGGTSEHFAPLRQFADEKLGKTVIDCNDTPGFIANRIGTYWIQSAIVLALESGWRSRRRMP